MSSKNSKENEYNANLDLQLSCIDQSILKPRRSGIAGESNHLWPTYVGVKDNKFVLVLGLGSHNICYLIDEMRSIALTSDSGWSRGFWHPQSLFSNLMLDL